LAKKKIDEEKLKRLIEKIIRKYMKDRRAYRLRPRRRIGGGGGGPSFRSYFKRHYFPPPPSRSSEVKRYKPKEERISYGRFRNPDEKVTKIIRQEINTRKIVEELKQYLGNDWVEKVAEEIEKIYGNEQEIEGEIETHEEKVEPVSENEIEENEELEVNEETETEVSEEIESEESLEGDVETVEKTEEVSEVIGPEDSEIEEIPEVPLEEPESVEELEEIPEGMETTSEDIETSVILDAEAEIFDDVETWNELENELYEEPRQEEVEVEEGAEAY